MIDDFDNSCYPAFIGTWFGEEDNAADLDQSPAKISISITIFTERKL